MREKDEALVTNKNFILFSAKMRKIKSSLWLHRYTILNQPREDFHHFHNVLKTRVTRLDLQFQKIILNKVFGQSENKLTDELFLICI